MPDKQEQALSGDYVRALVGARGRILQFAVGSTLAAAVLVFLLPRWYTAQVVILPSEQAKRKPPAEMMALASTLGMNLPFGAGGGSDLYPTLLESDRMLRPLLDEPFRDGSQGAARPLTDWLSPPGGAEAGETRREEALHRLRDDVVRAHKDAESDLVTLQVTTDSPQLSAAIANRLANGLEKYLVQRRQDKGAGNREFLSGRRESVEADLAAAERALAEFRRTNRRIDSPSRQLQEQRLLRERALQQQLRLEILRQEEMAKLAETRDTPVARVLDMAERPIRPSLPAKGVLVALAAVLGFLVPTAGVILRTAAEDRR